LALETHGLSKRYGRGVWALRDVTLKIESGGVTALVGPNAAGKSTLIRTWLGFERPTAGTVRVAGHDPWRDRRSALAALGYVPQMAPVYEALSVKEHLELVGRLRPGFDHSSAQARLDVLRVPLSARPRELSGGQRAQIILALALGTRAEVLLLDEPLAHLDPLARRDFLRVVQSAVATENRTAVLSSHVVTDIEQTCDAILVLGAGRVLLHSGIADAISGHAVAVDPDLGVEAVGDFAAPDGTLVRLVQASADDQLGQRPATLEEIVLGYLASARHAS
jgi:ABC-2 type transport system ATP-binding protein